MTKKVMRPTLGFCSSKKSQNLPIQTRRSSKYLPPPSSALIRATLCLLKTSLESAAPEQFLPCLVLCAGIKLISIQLATASVCQDCGRPGGGLPSN